jgi:hypothetical protein
MVEKGDGERRLLDAALEIYEEHGSAAVQHWGREQGLPFRSCPLCEIETPFVGETCAICWSKGSGNG